MDLSKAEISFRIEPLDESPEGHYGYDDPKAERDQCEWVYAQLADGNECAWCGFVVTAKLGTFEGSASLWACSYESEAAMKADLLSDLTAEALQDLRQNIDNTRQELEAIEVL